MITSKCAIRNIFSLCCNSQAAIVFTMWVRVCMSKQYVVLQTPIVAGTTTEWEFARCLHFSPSMANFVNTIASQLCKTQSQDFSSEQLGSGGGAAIELVRVLMIMITSNDYWVLMGWNINILTGVTAGVTPFKMVFSSVLEVGHTRFSVQIIMVLNKRFYRGALWCLPFNSCLPALLPVLEVLRLCGTLREEYLKDRTHAYSQTGHWEPTCDWGKNWHLFTPHFKHCSSWNEALLPVYI